MFEENEISIFRPATTPKTVKCWRCDDNCLRFAMTGGYAAMAHDW
jgi:hypothetical protein